MPETNPTPAAPASVPVPLHGERFHTNRYDNHEYAGRYRIIDKGEFYDDVRKLWTIWDTLGFAYNIFWDADQKEWKEEVQA